MYCINEVPALGRFQDGFNKVMCQGPQLGGVMLYGNDPTGVQINTYDMNHLLTKHVVMSILGWQSSSLRRN